MIQLERVSKHFTLYHNQSDRLKTRVLGRFYSRYRRTPERFAALEDISFSVRRGQAFGLIGANGSGKSTLLQIIAGILVPDTGEVRVRGRVAPLIELGAGFHPELTGNENIFLNASLYGMTNRQIRQRMDAIIEFSGLGSFIDLPIKIYSSGMYLRLAFSVAIHLDPDVLLADEILAVGDAEFQEKCLDRVRQMRAQGMTLILVSHSPMQVAQFTDRYIKLAHGKVVERGRSADLRPGLLDTPLGQ